MSPGLEREEALTREVVRVNLCERSDTDYAGYADTVSVWQSAQDQPCREDWCPTYKPPKQKRNTKATLWFTGALSFHTCRIGKLRTKISLAMFTLPPDM